MTDAVDQIAKAFPNFFGRTEGSHSNEICIRRRAIVRQIEAHEDGFDAKGLKILIRNVLKHCYGAGTQRLNLTRGREIQRCLRRFAQVRDLDVQVPQLGQVALRDSALPRYAEDESTSQKTCAWWRAFQTSSKKTFAANDWLLYVFSLVSELGYGYRLALHVVANLEVRHLASQHFSVPIHPDETRGFVHERQWPDNHIAALKRLYRINLGQGGSKEQTVFDSTVVILESQLETISRAKCGASARAINKGLRPLAWQHNGLAPALYRALNQLPLPVEADGGIGFFLKDVPVAEPAKRIEKENTTASTREAAIADLATVRSRDPIIRRLEERISSNWQQEVKAILRQFTQGLMKIGEKKLTNKNKQRLTQLTDETIEAFGLPKWSAPVLAVDWIERRLLSKQIQFSTACGYLTDVLTQGFLNHPGAYKLKEWDQEDFDALLDHVKLQNTANATREGRIQRITSFVNFCKREHGLFNGIQVASGRGGYVEVNFRNQIVSLSDFDKFLKDLIHSGHPNTEQFAMLCGLGFYGKMRASETLNLTLADVFMPEHEINLMVRDTKTIAGSRTVPLHAVAPTWFLKTLRSYLERRRQLQTSLKLTGKEIAAVGPRNSAECFDREDILEKGIRLLRAEFGSSVDFHALRHSGTTWLLVQLRVARGCLGADTLSEGEHELLHPPALSRLMNLFDERSSMTDFIVVRKLIGHASFATTLCTYTHCFGLLCNRSKSATDSADLIPDQQVIANPLS